MSNSLHAPMRPSRVKRLSVLNLTEKAKGSEAT